TGAVLARLYDRAGRADDAQGLPCAIRSDRGSGQDAIPDTSAHAAAWLRLCPSQCRPRHTGATSLARPQEHSPHGPLHRAVAASIQGLLALRTSRLRTRATPCVPHSSKHAASESPEPRQPATCSIAASRCDLFETAGRIAETGQLTALAPSLAIT